MRTLVCIAGRFVAKFNAAPERTRVVCLAGRACRVAEHSPETVMTAAIVAIKLSGEWLLSGLVVYVANRICFILKDLIGMLNLEEEDWVEALRPDTFQISHS